LRARQKKRQQTRRITIIVTVVIIAVSIAVGIYFVSTANQGTALDKYDGVQVSTQDMTSLQSVSDQPYGPAATTAMQAAISTNTPVVPKLPKANAMMKAVKMALNRLQE